MRRQPKHSTRPPRSIASAFAFAFVVGVMACLTSCLSPTLPLPPPELPQSLKDRGDGFWTVQGTCIPGAEVIVLNEATGLGAVIVDVDQNGAYFVEIRAKLCDFITVAQSIGTEESAKAGFVIEPLTNGMPQGSVCSQ